MPQPPTLSSTLFPSILSVEPRSMQCLLEVASTEQGSPGSTCIMSCPRGFCPQVGQRGKAEPILWEGLLPLALTKCVCVPHPCLLSRLGYQLIRRSSCLPLHSRETHLYGPKRHWCLTAESSRGFILQNNFTD